MKPKCLLRLVLITLAMAAMAGASVAQQLSGNGYEISGKEPLLAGQTIYLLAPGKPSPWQDSTQVDAAGQFVLRGRVPVADVYILRVSHQFILKLVPLANQNERLTAQLDPEVLKMTKQPPTYMLSVSATPELELLREATHYLALRQAAVPAKDRQLREFKRELRAHASSYLAPYLAYNYLYKQDTERPFLDSLTTRFAREQPASPYLPRLRELLGVGAMLDIGAVAPDITLTGPDGQTVRLSSLRGRYVLLDFWASWCQPCREENSNTVAAYQKFQKHGPGFTVYSVSVDEDRAKWIRAVQEDKLPWMQVADLAGFKGATASLYKIRSIPTTYLLDPDGRIVAKDLRGGALSRELNRLLH